MLRVFTHDVQGPMAAVDMCLGILSDEKAEGLSPEQRALLAHAANGLSMASDMIGSLSDVLKLEADDLGLNKKHVDLVALSHEAVARLQASPKACPIDVSAEPERITLLCDRTLLGRCLRNMTACAVKNAKAGNSVDLRLEATPDDVHASVAYRGPVLAEELRGRLFDKFGQAGLRSDQSDFFPVGLALPFIKLAVCAHGGTCGLSSEPDRTNRLWFRVPRDNSPAGRSEQEAKG